MKQILLQKIPTSIAQNTHPVILQYPCKNLLQPTGTKEYGDLSSGTKTIVCDQLLTVRRYYEYPGLSAVQLGCHFPAFVVNITSNSCTYTLNTDKNYISRKNNNNYSDLVASDRILKMKDADLHGTHVCINPEYLWTSTDRCWAWEACASCCFLMHYIERPKDIIVQWIDTVGHTVVARLAGMGSRLFQHEMDHLSGIAFYKRIPSMSHAVPTAGFRTMSMWKNDFPSIEARSTYLYTLYTPPFSFRTETPAQSSFLERMFDEEVYPGVQYDEAMCENFHHVLRPVAQS